MTKKGNIKKLYYRRHKQTLVTKHVDEVKGPQEPKRARSLMPLVNVNGTSPCLHSQSPFDFVSVESSTSLNCHSSDVRLSCERYKCHLCFTVVHTKSAMIGHFFVFHPSASSNISLKRQKMRVLLTKLSEVEIMKELCRDPREKTMVDSDEQLVSGWVIEHIPEIKIAGELVWAKLTGFPWWPGVILDDPKSKCHFRTSQSHSCVSAETEYHVLFFDKQSMQRAWIAESNLEAFQTDSQKSLTKPQSSKYKVRYAEAISWIHEVYDWSSSDRKKFFAVSLDGKS